LDRLAAAAAVAAEATVAGDESLDRDDFMFQMQLSAFLLMFLFKNSKIASFKNFKFIF
jgi:hypothetical protein